MVGVWPRAIGGAITATRRFPVVRMGGLKVSTRRRRQANAQLYPYYLSATTLQRAGVLLHASVPPAPGPKISRNADTTLVSQRVHKTLLAWVYIPTDFTSRRYH
jgi:hypothetical protein